MSGWRVVSGSTGGLADVDAFIARLDAGSAWLGRGPLFLARAPGRLDLMGGIADYSGSLVLELPLERAAIAVAAIADDGHLRVRTTGAGAVAAAEAAFPLVELRALADLDAAGAYFRAAPTWAAYIAGTAVALHLARGVGLGRGLRLLVDSRVPAGAGVSSSAAIEVASMAAVAACAGVALPSEELASRCQAVENRIVGAPCGIMDQMTSACGRAGQLLALRCQPAEIEGFSALPDDLACWGIDSGERHHVGGADYGAVRVGAFMGQRILAEAAGLRVQRIPERRVSIDDPRWGGWLANIAPSETVPFLPLLPERMDGAAFLVRYGGIADTVTNVDAARGYAVLRPTLHPIEEHHRVRCFSELLAGPATPRGRALLGELMYQSHASYGACGLGSPGTDLLVRLVREAGPASGLLGAKITGGGSGGTIAVLGRADAEPAVREIAERYRARMGKGGTILAGSSPGAAAFGTLTLEPA